MYIQVDAYLTMSAVDKLKTKPPDGTQILVVGIGNNIDVPLLRDIASTPGSYFRANDFDALFYRINSLIQTICPGM